MKKIVRARALPRYRLALTFDDGVAGTVDLGPLAGKGVFGIWNDPELSQSSALGHQESFNGAKQSISARILYICALPA